MEDTKITIIEGPTPTFEIVYDGWANGIIDGPSQASVALTRLRTANGPALVERCYRAWNRQDAMNLEFRATDGYPQELPTVAARATETDQGDMLMLWVRLPESELILDFIDGNDEGDEYDDFEDDDFEDEDFDDDDEYDDFDDDDFDDEDFDDDNDYDINF